MHSMPDPGSGPGPLAAHSEGGRRVRVSLPVTVNTAAADSEPQPGSESLSSPPQLPMPRTARPRLPPRPPVAVAPMTTNAVRAGSAAVRVAGVMYAPYVPEHFTQKNFED
jgi:hypothetical protein